MNNSFDVQIWLMLVCCQKEPLLEEHLSLIKDINLPFAPSAGTELSFHPDYNSMKRADFGHSIVGLDFRFEMKNGKVVFDYDRKVFSIYHHMGFSKLDVFNQAVKELRTNFGFRISGEE